ncbi:MAG: helix-turn-helix domain-containing protein, partial [bacterium]|nr:helix-turn-helix domain-containing protein [bacterium]
MKEKGKLNESLGISRFRVRTQLALSQARLAKVLGVGRSALVQYELGSRPIPHS